MGAGSQDQIENWRQARSQIQGCFKTEWSDGRAENGVRERSVGDFLISIDSFI